MKINKSELMKKAWMFFRNSIMRKNMNISTFADALRAAWGKAKKSLALAIKAAHNAKTKIGFVSVRSLNIGDTIEVAPPGCGCMYKTRTIVTINDCKGFDGINITFTDGGARVFGTHDNVERLSIAV